MTMQQWRNQQRIKGETSNIHTWDQKNKAGQVSNVRVKSQSLRFTFGQFQSLEGEFVIAELHPCDKQLSTNNDSAARPAVKSIQMTDETSE